MANIQYYDVILKPVITEKSMNNMAAVHQGYARYGGLAHAGDHNGVSHAHQHI